MYSSPPLRPWLGLAAGVLALTPAPPAPAAGPLDVSAELKAVLREETPADVPALRLLQEQVRRVVGAARPATVAVELDDSVGSGVVVTPEGLVLTAGHVCVEPNRALTLRFADGRRVRGRSLGVNHRIDSGLIRITEEPPGAEGEAGEWPFVPVATAPTRPGDWVVGLGQPNGFVEGRDPPVRLGRVLFVERDALNTDATLVGGDSGGPLLNLRGEVVGIHSKIGEQITSNYHVPASAYRRDWVRLERGRMIGVPDGEDPDDWRPHAGLALRDAEGGPVVTQVFPERPAAESGVQPGDVVERLANAEVSSVAEADRLLRRLDPYERVPLLVRRGAVTVELELWLGRVSIDFPGTLSQEPSP